MKKFVKEDLKNCCSCGACKLICPKNAINMIEDENGFVYPIIEEKNCINCNACLRVCPYEKNKNDNFQKEAFVALNKNTNQLKKSSSGGAFSSVANSFLKENGIICGCSMEYEDNLLTPKHIFIEKQEELDKIQGSKYVQSDLNDTFQKTKTYLEEGKKVLFSGTPCQIAGLKAFLRKEYENLYTMDLICHGTPSVKLFRDYIKFLEKTKKIKITNLTFRDKINGWGLNGRIDYIDKKNCNKKTKLFTNESSYYYFFQKGHLYKINCYSCPYASENRPADLTIGDYWGIEKEHPELLNKINIKDGVSCLIVNNEKGKELLEKYGNNLDLYESSFIKIQRNNAQLEHPTKLDNLRDEIFESYRKDGYIGVEKLFRKKIGIKLIFIKIKNRIPTNFKRKVKKLLKK